MTLNTLHRFFQLFDAHPAVSAPSLPYLGGVITVSYRIYPDLCIDTYIVMYMCVYVHMHTCTCICVCNHTHVCALCALCVCVFVCVCVCVFVCVFVCVTVSYRIYPDLCIAALLASIVFDVVDT